MLLNINGVSRSLGHHNKETVILDNINLNMQIGEIFSIIGLNGAGKTTLINSILNLSSITSGSIFIDGIICTDYRSRYALSYLPEKFMPSQYLTGLEFLTLSGYCFGKTFDKHKIYDMSEKIGLDPSCLSRKIMTYSKGMSQKLGIMSCFLSDAKFLILDEPMSGLDPLSRMLVKTMMKEYCAKLDKSIFFSSHILADVEELCDKIAILHNAKIIFNDRVEILINQNLGKGLEYAFLNVIKE